MRVEFDTRDAADYPGLSPKTLEKWRVFGEGPSFIKMGALVRYSQADIDSWLESRRRRSTSDPGGQG